MPEPISQQHELAKDEISNQFFDSHISSDKVVQAIRNKIFKQEQEKPFISKFVNYAGYPIWDKSVVINTSQLSISYKSGNPDEVVVFIPLALSGDSSVNAILKAGISSTDTVLSVQYHWQYKMNYRQLSKDVNTADLNALLFMGLESHTFAKTDFKMTDSLLLRAEGALPYSNIRIKSFLGINETGSVNERYTTNVLICYNVWTPVYTNARISKRYQNSNNHRDGWSPIRYNVTEVCTNVREDFFGGGGGGSGNNDEGGGGGGGSNGDNGWEDDPCISDASQRTAGLISPCDDTDPGWLPKPFDRDENGYLYSRINELQSILSEFPQALEPCDSLNIMPFETFGPMWQDVAQFVPGQYVMDRIDSIKQVAPQWWGKIDNFNIQTLEDGKGAIVNCDFFPVRIIQMPTGYTPESLLEMFRTHINSFIDPDLHMSFGPYLDGNFIDIEKYTAPYEESIGSLWHLELGSAPGLDGSVIESGYTRYNSAGFESNYFTVSTMETPLDFEHPVSGNRRFGIYSDPDHPGEYVFYTMGVDRIWDGVFDLGNRIKQMLSKKNGFDDADKLWSSLQNGMIQFIQDQNGAASLYSNHKSVARPNWRDVEEYLQGHIDFIELKRRLGC